ncbi:putative regulatory prophage protein [Salmonella phage SE40]|nr:putative regulatory prophage protein [Salmonella phage SE40]
MLREGELMLGCDENGEVVTNTYRLPTGIDDRKRPKNRYEPNDYIKATEGDLE